jgi:hypothetical protein
MNTPTRIGLMFMLAGIMLRLPSQAAQLPEWASAMFFLVGAALFVFFGEHQKGKKE